MSEPDDETKSRSQQPPPKEAEGKSGRLSIWRAAIDALLSRPIDFYPRVKLEDKFDPNNTKVGTLKTNVMLAEMANASATWSQLKSDGDSLKDALQLARQSLDKAKGQTEYQDQKATRLLTVTTFLTALSGALFARFNDKYEFNANLDIPCWQVALIFACYVAFGLFILSALLGALVTFHATRTRFKYDAIGEPAKETCSPKSRLFYAPILGVRPSAWIHSFVNDPTATEPKLNDALQPRYFLDLVGEAYLVSAKTADKLRYLGPAQSLLAVSLRCLLGWLVLLTIIGLIISPTHTADSPAKVIVTNLTEIAPVKTAAAPRPSADQVDPTKDLVQGHIVNNPAIKNSPQSVPGDQPLPTPGIKQ